MITVFLVILVANSITLAISVVAAIKRPSLSYMLIGAVALCSTLFALQQVVTGRANPVGLIFTALLIIMIAWARRRI
jgi:hypothetical protein